MNRRLDHALHDFLELMMANRTASVRILHSELAGKTH